VAQSALHLAGGEARAEVQAIGDRVPKEWSCQLQVIVLHELHLASGDGVGAQVIGGQVLLARVQKTQADEDTVVLELADDIVDRQAQVAGAPALTDHKLVKEEKVLAAPHRGPSAKDSLVEMEAVVAGHLRQCPWPSAGKLQLKLLNSGHRTTLEQLRAVVPRNVPSLHQLPQSRVHWMIGKMLEHPQCLMTCRLLNSLNLS